MKKIILILIILIFAGITTLNIGIRLGAETNFLSQITKYSYKKLSSSEFITTDLESSIKNINITGAGIENAYIVSASKFSMRHNFENISMNILDDTLNIEILPIENNFIYDVLAALDIEIGNFTRELCIYVPNDVTIDNVSVNLHKSDFTIANSLIDNLDLTLNVGDLDIENSKINDSVAVNITNGDVDISLLNKMNAYNLNVISENGKYKLDKDSKYLGDGTKPFLVNVTFGDVDISFDET